LHACSLLLKLFKGQSGTKQSETLNPIDLNAEPCKAIERFVEINLIGSQSDLKFKDKRSQLAQALNVLAMKVNY